MYDNFLHNGLRVQDSMNSMEIRWMPCFVLTGDQCKDLDICFTSLESMVTGHTRSVLESE